MEGPQLQELCRQRWLAKKAEDEAAARRKDIDAQIAEALKKPELTEGTASEKLEGFKVSVTYGITRKLDTEALRNDWTKVPAAVQACIKWKSEVSTTEFRKLGKDDVLVLSEYMESKPASPSVKVEVI